MKTKRHLQRTGSRKISSLPTARIKRLSQILEQIKTPQESALSVLGRPQFPLPSTESARQIICSLSEIVFPGYFEDGRAGKNQNPKKSALQTLENLFDELAAQIELGLAHFPACTGLSCHERRARAERTALALIEDIPALQEEMAADVDAAFHGDPAATCHKEVILCYPGLMAIFVYRIAHRLYLADIPLLPRVMTEYAHSVTGIDIHPGATIGKSFVIDHGTGVVVGETTQIGDNVRIYQGVTLGALSVPAHACDLLRRTKRHPTIEDDVIIYSGATILGGETRIGARSVIGGNVWLTHSVNPDTRVVMEGLKVAFFPRRPPNSQPPLQRSMA
ncbi:MAG: serine acetyltransferase [Desulfatibacillaceae bacterium]|nr:serine acetyltransferase [Desulfatibacillaceae bacterium]